MFNFRPHHFVCAYFYRGAGYSPEFVANFDQILATLQENPNEKLIYLVNGADSICKCCPSSSGVDCQNMTKVSPLDQVWLDFFGLKVGDSFSWNELCDIVAGKSLLNAQAKACGYSDFINNCRDCQWFSHCEPIAKTELP
jgi:hypothetical protein